MTFAAAIATMILVSLGQMLLKVIAERTRLDLGPWQEQALKLLLVGGALLIIYAFAIGCWLFVLRSIELNRAYAFVGLSFVFVPVFSYFFLGEKISLNTIAGSTFIVGGIWISSYR